jgi:hypothetical protein
VGYSETPTRQYGCLDTWYPPDEVRWCDFLQMASGRPWGVFKGWSFDPDATIFVDDSGGGDFLTIQEGMDAAVAGATVHVLPGTYTGSWNRDLTPRGKSIHVVSTDGPEATIIDCQGLGRGFNFQGQETAACVVDGFTVRNGAGAPGGGVRCYFNCSPTLRNLRLEDCASTGNGGGIFCGMGASPALESVAIVGCSATGSGGGISFSTTTATVEDVSVHGCSSGANAGGIACSGANSRPSIVESIVSGSTAGPGLSCTDGANPTVTHSCVHGNAGGDGVCGTSIENISQDPLFCDAGAGDLTLRSDSPCLPDGNAWGVTMGAYGAGGCDTGVPDAGDGEAAALRAPYPNPAFGAVSLAFELGRAGEAGVTVHDAAGRVVRTLAGARSMAAGPHVVEWDGRDDRGREVPGGVYFCSVVLDGRRATAKLVVLAR